MNPLKTPQALNERTMTNLHTSWSQTRNVELVRKSFLSQNYNTKQNSKMFPKVKVNVEQAPRSYTFSVRTRLFMAHSGIWLIPNMLGPGLLCGWLTSYPLWCFGVFVDPCQNLQKCKTDEKWECIPQLEEWPRNHRLLALLGSCWSRTWLRQPNDFFLETSPSL